MSNHSLIKRFHRQHRQISIKVLKENVSKISGHILSIVLLNIGLNAKYKSAVEYVSYYITVITVI
jgi:hypothetical protein